MLVWWNRRRPARDLSTALVWTGGVPVSSRRHAAPIGAGRYTQLLYAMAAAEEFDYMPARRLVRVDRLGQELTEAYAQELTTRTAQTAVLLAELV